MISYEHGGSETLSDNFLFDVADPLGAGTTGQIFNIVINSVNDAPILLINELLSLNQVTTSIITNTQLVATDADNNAPQITYTLTVLPEKGTVKLNGNPISVNGSFSQDEINNNLVSYEHTGTQTTEDNFTFNVKDPFGEGPTNQMFSITINLTNNFVFTPVILALNSILLKEKSKIISGDIFVNNIGTGKELTIGEKVQTPSGYSLKANRIKVKEKAQIGGDVFYNELINKGKIKGSINSPLTLPIYSSLPIFKEDYAGTENITVNCNKTVLLPAGAYSSITIKEKGTLVFTGGVYNLDNLKAEDKTNIFFAASSEIRIDNRLKFGEKSKIGPQDGSGISSADIVFYVKGHGPNSVNFGEKSSINANFYAPNGTLTVSENANFIGSLIANDVIIGENAKITLGTTFTGELLKINAAFDFQEEMSSIEVPNIFALFQNYPNPFNPSTQISYSIPQKSFVNLKVYDLLGKEISQLINEEKEAGSYEVNFDASTLSSGVYFYQIESWRFY